MSKCNLVPSGLKFCFSICPLSQIRGRKVGEKTRGRQWLRVSGEESRGPSSLRTAPPDPDWFTSQEQQRGKGNARLERGWGGNGSFIYVFKLCLLPRRQSAGGSSRPHWVHTSNLPCRDKCPACLLRGSMWTSRHVVVVVVFLLFKFSLYMTDIKSKAPW